MRIIALTNQKGGVGKTTTTVNLADALARQGHRPLVIDMDEQADSTAILGIDPRGDHPNVFDVLMSSSWGTLGDAIQESTWEGISIVPGTPDVGAFATSPGILSAEGRLRRAAHGAELGETSVVLIDLPPSLGRLSLNALVWATDALIVTSPERLGVLGVGKTIEAIETLKMEPDLNPDLNLAGVLVNGVNGSIAEHAFQLEQLRDAYSEELFSTVIPQRAAITNTPSVSAPARATAARSSAEAAGAYEALARELMERIEPK